MASVSQERCDLSGDAMFVLFRYGLMPVVSFCVVVIAASFDVYLTNTVQKSTWPQTVVTVMQSQDLGQVAAEFRGTQNTFPDPRGTLEYVIDGRTYTWQGRGHDIGVTAMNPGDKINVYYNPQNPREISTLLLLGAATGNIILAVALAFLAFYVWFFWLRGFFRRSGPDDFRGDAVGSFADRVPERLPDQIERSRFALGDKHPTAINQRPTGPSFDRRRGATFGKR
jgi:hypothetical protein